MTRTSEEHFDLLSFVTILRRQYRLIVLLVFMVLVIAFLFIVRTTPLYTATALVKVDPQETNLLDPTAVSTISSTTESTRIETEVEVLKSARLALQTIVLEDLQQTDEFGPQLGLVDKFRAAMGLETATPPSQEVLTNRTLRKFTDSLSVRRKGLTYLVTVQFTSSDPQLSAEIANAHAGAYIQSQVADRMNSSLAARDVLQAQLDQARQRLAQSNGAAQNFVEENVKRIASETGSEALATLSTQLNSAALTLEDSEQLLTMSRLEIEKGGWASLADSVGDSALQSLNAQRQTLMERLGKANAGSVEAFDLQKGLAALDQEIKSRGEDALDRLQAEVSRSRDARGSILKAIQAEALQSNLSDSTLTEIYELQQEAQIAQRQYDTLIGRMRDLEAQAVLQVASSQIVSEAIVPSQPSFPNKRLVFLTALFGALGLGVGVAMLKEFFLGGITSASQLGNVVPVKVGAVVPKMNSQSATAKLADQVIKEPMAQFAEAFRKLHASIDHSTAGDSGKARVILVSSAIPAEGKSTTALSLARTYANAGKKTLLIDADLRNPSIHKFLNEKPEFGLMDYLLSETEQEESPDAESKGFDRALIEEFYVIDNLSPLGVILGNRRADVPTDAPLQSKAFHDLIDETRETFDVVVIDCAPLLPVVDPQYIAPYVDVALLCVRFGEASQMELRTAYAHLADGIKPGTPVIGVLNFSETRRQEYRYGSYYG